MAEKVRISCQSTNWSDFCLVSEDTRGGPIGGFLGEALDRCKGVGCERNGQPCPTQFLVDRETAERLKREHGVVIIG